MIAAATAAAVRPIRAAFGTRLAPGGGVGDSCGMAAACSHQPASLVSSPSKMRQPG